MKRKLIIAVTFLILKSTLGFSQKDSSGIYFTANDYVKHKLSFAINCETQKHKIKSDMIFHPKEISIKHADSTYTYPKDSIYGIKYCDGSIVRVYNNSEYPLINPDEKIMIYKIISGPATKGSPSITRYYFSKDANGKIQELTIYNIKAAFPDNHKFHDLVDMEFHSNDELAAYDTFHKIMKINRVLNISKENEK
ncbi:MAG: hypothetical protein Q7W45_14965 [Bacteroidota bacterium]|nr:hypothetical protein [Bacteroidota bacterium]MDP3147332.1 hypothetical protein [Bacteroidota bacterium]